MLSLAPDTLLEAENLISGGKLLSFNPLDKGVWVGVFQLKSSIETELWMTASRVKDAQCDCTKFKDDNWCVHATALLIHWQSQRKKISLPADKEASNTRTAVKRDHHRITVRHLLRYIEADDLQDFIMEYARQDKKFEMYFKSHFLTKVRLEDDDQRYEDLVQEILKFSIASSPSQKINARQVRQFTQAVDKLADQAINLLEAFNYRETFIILQVLTQKVMPALLRHHAFPQTIKSLQKLEHLFIELAQAKLSPELSDQFSQLKWQVLDQYAYRPASASGNLWQLRSMEDSLPAGFEYIISDAVSSESAPIAIATLLHFKPDYIKEKEIVKKWSLPSWDNFLEAIQSLQSLEKHAPAILELMIRYLPAFLHEKALVMLFKRDTTILKSEQVQETFTELFLKNGNVELFESLGIKDRLRLLQYLRSKCTSAEDYYKYFTAVSSLRRLEIMDKELRTELDFARLFGMVQFINKEQLLFIQDKVFTIIESHLENHIGPQNSEKVAFILSNISLKADTKYFKALKDKILKHFGKRVSLREVLA